jgi:hypothetical protein
MCIFESELSRVYFKFAEASSNDPNPLVSNIDLTDNCQCNVCPESRGVIDWSDAAAEKQWSDFKEFTLDVDFEGGNSTLCIKAMTIKIDFKSE